MTRGAGVILYIAGSSDDESPHRGCGRTEGNYIQPEERAGQSLRLVTDPERNPVQRAKRETNLTEYRGGGRKGWMRRDETTEAGPMYRDDEIDRAGMRCEAAWISPMLLWWGAQARWWNPVVSETKVSPS
jgi:hypothetical protein